MPNKVFLAAVKHRLINVLGGMAVEAQKAARESSRHSPEDVVAFVDLQSLHHFLKENCRVHATRVHITNLIRDFARSHGLKITEIVIVTGIHDKSREPTRHEAMAKRVRWMERCGAVVHTIPLSYKHDRETGKLRAVEKGVDVRIGAEIIRRTVRGLRKIILISQDRDLAESIRVAKEIAHERGYEIEAYSPSLAGAQWEHNGKCGMHGVPYTKRLPMSVDLVRRHERIDEEDQSRAEQEGLNE